MARCRMRGRPKTLSPQRRPGCRGGWTPLPEGRWVSPAPAASARGPAQSALQQTPPRPQVFRRNWGGGANGGASTTRLPASPLVCAAAPSARPAWQEAGNRARPRSPRPRRARCRTCRPRAATGAFGEEATPLSPLQRGSGSDRAPPAQDFKPQAAAGPERSPDLGRGRRVDRVWPVARDAAQPLPIVRATARQSARFPRSYGPYHVPSQPGGRGSALGARGRRAVHAGGGGRPVRAGGPPLPRAARPPLLTPVSQLLEGLQALAGCGEARHEHRASVAAGGARVPDRALGQRAGRRPPLLERGVAPCTRGARARALASRAAAVVTGHAPRHALPLPISCACDLSESLSNT